MSKRVNNGRRVPVKFGAYEGQAGVVDHGGGVSSVAFFSSIKRLGKPTAGEIDGVPVIVTSIDESSPASSGVAGMVKLLVREAAKE